MDNDPVKRKLYQTPTNLRLKRAALCAIIPAIIMLAMLPFCADNLSETVQLIMRGCIGTLAIVFVVLCTILVYRVNTQYISGKH